MPTYRVRYEYAIKSRHGGLETRALGFKVAAHTEADAERLADIIGKSNALPCYDHHILTNLYVIQPYNE